MKIIHIINANIIETIKLHFLIMLTDITLTVEFKI